MCQRPQQLSSSPAAHSKAESAIRWGLPLSQQGSKPERGIEPLLPPGFMAPRALERTAAGFRANDLSSVDLNRTLIRLLSSKQ